MSRLLKRLSRQSLRATLLETELLEARKLQGEQKKSSVCKKMLLQLSGQLLQVTLHEAQLLFVVMLYKKQYGYKRNRSEVRCIERQT